jgi:GAF domain-containing protein
MRRRNKTGGKEGKIQRTKTLKRHNALKTARHRNFSAAEQIGALTRELKEAREQQTATAEVLRVISGSPGELEPVFQTMLENARRICEAEFGVLYRCEGEALRVVVMHGAPQAFVEERRRNPLIRPPPQTALGRAMATKQSVQIADVENEPHYFDAPPGYSAVVLTKLSGARTVLAVPMLKENELIGAIVIWRTEVRPFSDKQIELVQSFAAQAVIAIENTRLLNELRQRTSDLSEALEQQTATSEVLKIISSSPGDLTPVFDEILNSATRICEAKFGILYLRDGDAYNAVATTRDAPPEYVEVRKRESRLKPAPDGPVGGVLATRQAVQIPDFRELKSYHEGHRFVVTAVELGGFRTALGVPLLRDDELVGAISIMRQEVRPFTEKQVELVKNFAAQAVIAIENTRLLNELRESLQQQTATADVLKVISRSTFDLQAVLDTLVESAACLCGAEMANIWRPRDGGYRHTASYGVTARYKEHLENKEFLNTLVIEPSRGTTVGRVLLERRTVHIHDIQADPDYKLSGLVALGGTRTMLGVPILRQGEPIGVLVLVQSEVRPFTDKQIGLATTFADQAAIAIENARLLKELRERTDQVEAQSQEVAKLNQQLEQRVADQVSEIERMSRLRRFLPPQVADLIVASGAEKQLEGHRREVTALFCDLRGFTGFSESSDPEDVMALLHEYHAAIGGIINQYGGTLERYAGDGVMVVFNDPIPVDNPALQAVRMAIDMRAAIGELIEKWRKLGHDIGFGIGIAHGFATLGTIGFEGRFDYAAIGTVSNVASRLCDEAKPGQILISPRVLMAVEKDVAVEPVGDFALKGIRRPLTAHNVLGTKAAD